MTDGQRLALEQLREIESASAGAFGIVSVQETDPGWVHVDFSLSCSDMNRLEGGLPLRPRERFNIVVAPDFPFTRPAVWTTHTRFAGFPHVQWKRHLCLYQAPATEWDPGDGMYGFVNRLDMWLRRGALGEWETVGEALHPPVAYYTSGPTRTIIPRVNTPQAGENNWYGVAHLNTVSDLRTDITSWSHILADEIPQNVAAAVLLSEPMPFEFPKKVSDLMSELTGRGILRRMLILTLQRAVLANGEEDPLYVVIGTPMRGVRGTEEPKQHLTAWYLSPTMAQALRLAINTYDESEVLRDIGQRAEAIFFDWAEKAEVEWCRVLEDRPETVIRRDYEAPARWFGGRAVSLWGCGALGGHIAEFLARAGVRKLILRDNGLVGPGLLVRQPFDDLDVGRPKVEALEERLNRIRPDLDIDAFQQNILAYPLDSGDWTDGADLVIDTTASEAVLGKLELKRRTSEVRIPMVSMAIGHRAESGVVALAGAGYSGGPFDVTRRAKLEACNRMGMEKFADEFWPLPEAPRRKLFQPEPGCSDITYTGSDADVVALAATMLNLAAKDLATLDHSRASAHFFAQPHTLSVADEKTYTSFSWGADRVSIDPHAGYEIRIGESAWADMMAWVERSHRRVGAEVETGGLLFGERDDAARVVWVSEVIGPPPDSRASATRFVCGVKGTAEANDEKRKRTRESVRYVGMWHSHPGASPEFSFTDFEGMRQTIEAVSTPPSKSLLLIIGTPEMTPTVATYVFSRSDFAALRKRGYQVRTIVISPSAESTRKPRRIGLALSGGGSRAIAFHLGCLRALHDRGLLPQVDVISSVSGGSIITAMYAYSSDSFDEFDARTVELLRRGLARGILCRAILSKRLPAVLVTQAVAGTAAVGADLLRFLMSVGPRALGGGNSGAAGRYDKIRAPFRRWASFTTAFEQTLHDTLFKDVLMNSPRRDALNVVLNACELRTGSAFRLGSEVSGCWRYGRLPSNDIPVSLAVAASAAYPVFLPAIDRIFRFINRKGEEFTRRLFLTDGGVFDNLGVTCLEPGRSSDHSYHTFCPEYIICCDAGQGLFGDHVYPYHWASRMQRSFETVYRKAHDSIRQRLHSCLESGKLKGFVLSYLGQIDSALPLIPPDLVRREEVYRYPTDFSPMKDDDISLIVERGEQLTRLLISRYCPEL
jgi:integrative and conjugative element protein (TIGR02256 family)